MVRRAGQVVVVTGSEKLGRRTFARICPAASVHTLVTDTDAPAEQVAEIRAAGITVQLA
jgi:DeoR family transcriptional regulator, aga operon transcriptional repressor